MSATPHLSVLREPLVNALMETSPQRVVDGTLGAGGHALALLEAGAGALLGLDLDPQALALARERLKNHAQRVTLVQASYLSMATQAQKLGWSGVGAIVLDLGVSSMQLDQAERGFAFRQDGPLDMRFDPTGDRPPAAHIVNQWPEIELSAIFQRYGEEKRARRYARAIVEARSNAPIVTTSQLAHLITEATPAAQRRASKVHPATRVFQALRIAVNDELGSVERVLPLAFDLLHPGGRLAVITFHSLEDRLVKRFFKDVSTAIESPPGMASIEARPARARLLNRKPIEAADNEIAHNPRSRSAKLRLLEKLV